MEPCPDGRTGGRTHTLARTHLPGHGGAALDHATRRGVQLDARLRDLTRRATRAPAFSEPATGRYGNTNGHAESHGSAAVGAKG